MYNTLSYNSSLYNRYAVAVLGDDEETITINSALGIMTGDIVIIDTDLMTMTIDGTDYSRHLEDDSVYFKLMPGVNVITFAGTGTVDIEVTQKDRWY